MVVLVGSSPDVCAALEIALIKEHKDEDGNLNIRPGGEKKPDFECGCFVYVVGSDNPDVLNWMKRRKKTLPHN